MTERDLIFLVGVIVLGGTLVVFAWQAVRYFRSERDGRGEDSGAAGGPTDPGGGEPNGPRGR